MKPMPRVLIVDNETDICRTLKDSLEARGYDTIVAQDGRAAMALVTLEAKQGSITGVLLDVHMPIMDGLEALKEIRARQPKLPVIVFSAAGDRAILEQAMRVGATLYVTKPFDMHFLMYACDRLFRPGSAAEKGSNPNLDS
ncbi:MAG TPA: response regulator [Nitrospira sp.]|nr:response regulator [Nitrospira sp.]